jgi:hypothetical protein
MALPTVARALGVDDHGAVWGREWGYAGVASRPNIG